jgi:hypothetical protein
MRHLDPHKPRKPARIRIDGGLLVVVSVAAALLFSIIGPASAQFFDFGFGRRPPPPQAPRGYGGGGYGGPPQGQGGFFSPFQQFFPGGQPPQQPQRAVDYSRAPPPEKRDTVPEHNVLVLGDAMADWLAYGLEDAYAEQPDMGVLRRHKTNSGLIRYQPKGEPSEWTAAARGILAAEKADAIVVMLGLNDRGPIRESVEKKADPKKDDKARKPEDGKQDGKPDGDAAAADDADGDTPSILAPEKTTRTGPAAEFRDPRWIELYSKKIEDLIAVLKTKGVPVVWVGLPAVRGPKATADMLFLDQLYRDVAGKAGITYVDVWDGFVDEAGRFMQQGPDFEGQIRRLRSADGVFFTKAGARKLAHYVEREISRLLTSRSAPIALPSEPAQPDVAARPGGPAPRPLAGPIVPLVASSVGGDELLGGPGTRPTSWDALAARAMVKGEPLAAPAGRADDYAWPRREIAKFDPTREPVAATPTAARSSDPAPARAAAPPAVMPTDPAAAAAIAPDGTQPKPPTAAKKRPSTPPPAANNGGFFGFGFGAGPAPAPAPPAAARPARPRDTTTNGPRDGARAAPATAPRDGAPRPPAGIGRAAAAPEAVIAR